MCNQLRMEVSAAFLIFNFKSTSLKVDKISTGELQARFLGINSLINSALFNNRFSDVRRPLVNFAERLPVIRNPDFTSSLATYDSCTGINGESGLCAPSGLCSVFGGRPSGSCIAGNVCCISKQGSCTRTVSLTYTCSLFSRCHIAMRRYCHVE